ncbi:M56 family metallopeptidase [Mycobacterium intracellulare]|uniref:M56 family metallopeptidase n=1 Tax=Mycobacterium intracellulare TaxID=1767 RepID=UPI001CDA2823|nr:M56 family metallopeptidase [Mycobacterium intracellulare]MCA2247888.1 M56 family metallopeptidase [Mycobacterium intracellulare]
MSVAVCLLLYSFAVATLSPWVLPRLTHAGTVPRLGVAAWLVVMVSVVASWLAATGFLIVSLVRYWHQPGRLATACSGSLQRLVDGGAAAALQVALLVLAVAAVSALSTLGWRWGNALWRARAQNRRHAERARVIGRRIDGVDAVVVDAPERAAYCVAGPPDTVVVTSAALDSLTDPNLQAVLAHERAHLAGRHHYVLAFARALAVAIPGVPLFSTADREISLLLEMAADDAAARRYGSLTLLDALLALSVDALAPEGAFGATGIDVLARAQRLAAPPAARNRWSSRLLLTAATLLITGGPLILAALTAVGAMWCYPVAA